MGRDFWVRLVNLLLAGTSNILDLDLSACAVWARGELHEEGDLLAFYRSGAATRESLVRVRRGAFPLSVLFQRLDSVGAMVAGVWLVLRVSVRLLSSPLLSGPAGGRPATASGVHHAIPFTVRLLVLLREAEGLLPVRQELPGRVDEGGTRDNSTSVSVLEGMAHALGTRCLSETHAEDHGR